MAFEAHLIGGRAEQFGEISLMYGVARGTAPDGNRPMNEFALHYFGLVMALEAEFRAGCAELVLIGGLMGIMAGEALPLLYRGMHVLVRIEPLMTFRAELSGILDRRELVLAHRLMAEGAVAGRRRTVNKLLGAHFVVAVRGDAGVLGTGSRSGILRGAGKQNQLHHCSQQNQSQWNA
jgi:hypothetical protein